MAMLYVFYQGQQGSSDDGQMFYQRFDGTTWYGIQRVEPSGQPIGMSYAPSPVVWNGGLLQVFHQGLREDGQLWTTWTKDGLNGQNWAPEQQPIPNVGMSFSPATVVFNNKLYVFHPGSHQTGELWYTVADGTSWSEDMNILTNIGYPRQAGPMSLSPSAVVWNNALYVFFQNGLYSEVNVTGNPGGGGLFFVASTDGKGWGNVDGNHQPTRQLMNVGMSFSPSAVVWRNMIHVFHEGYGENQQLWYSYHDGQNWQPDQQVPGVVIGNVADAELLFGGVAPMSPSAVVFNNNCYVFYLNAQQNLSYKFANGTSWSQEAPVLDVPSQCGYVGCVVF